MEEGLAFTRRGGAVIRKGTRGLECRRQVHGGYGDGCSECQRVQRVLPGAGPILCAGEPLATARTYVGQRTSVPEALDANAKPVLTIAEHKELEKLRAEDQPGD